MRLEIECFETEEPAPVVPAAGETVRCDLRWFGTAQSLGEGPQCATFRASIAVRRPGRRSVWLGVLRIVRQFDCSGELL